MTNKRNYLCITIENAIDASVLNNNAELSTTKTDKNMHGLGTQSMQNIVEQYDGMIDFYERNGMFVVDIMVKREDRSTKQETEDTKRATDIELIKGYAIM